MALGLIGTALTRELLAAGWNVHHLGRSKTEKAGVRSFVWDIKKGVMDRAALEGVDHIVHLAGSGIADERWSASRVKQLVASRTETARLLLDVARTEAFPIKTFVSAAGIGYYGAHTSSHIDSETDPAGNDTIATIAGAVGKCGGRMDALFQSGKIAHSGWCFQRKVVRW